MPAQDVAVPADQADPAISEVDEVSRREPSAKAVVTDLRTTGSVRNANEQRICEHQRLRLNVESTARLVPPRDTWPCPTSTTRRVRARTGLKTAQETHQHLSHPVSAPHSRSSRGNPACPPNTVSRANSRLDTWESMRPLSTADLATSSSIASAFSRYPSAWHWGSVLEPGRGQGSVWRTILPRWVVDSMWAWASAIRSKGKVAPTCGTRVPSARCAWRNSIAAVRRSGSSVVSNRA